MPPKNITNTLRGFIWNTNQSWGTKGRRQKVNTQFYTSPGHIDEDIDGALKGLPNGVYAITVTNGYGVPYGLWHKRVRTPPTPVTTVEPA